MLPRFTQTDTPHNRRIPAKNTSIPTPSKDETPALALALALALVVSVEPPRNTLQALEEVINALQTNDALYKDVSVILQLAQDLQQAPHTNKPDYQTNLDNLFNTMRETFQETTPEQRLLNAKKATEVANDFAK